MTQAKGLVLDVLADIVDNVASHSEEDCEEEEKLCYHGYRSVTGSMEK